MNLIKDRDARTKNRKKAKDKFDKNITLSLVPMDNKKCTLAFERSEGYVRLLDEGSIVTASGDLDLYIKKGAIRKYVYGNNKKLTMRSIYGDIAEEYFKNPDEPLNIDNKYEGTINIGHQDFATFPFIVGTWTQDDLKVVNNGDGRKGLDVDLKLNPLHPLVQALEIQGIPVGVSVEMYLHVDEKATDELAEEKNIYAPVVDEIFISDFAIVGECGNVGSSDSVILQGVKMAKEEIVAEVTEEETIESPEEEVTEEVTEEVEETTEDVAEATEGEEEEDETAESEAEEDIEEESTEEAETEEEVSEEDVDEEDTSDTVLEALDSLQSEITTLKEQLEALKKTNKKLSKKLKAKNEADEKFMEKFKGLEVSFGEKKEEVKEEVTHTPYATGDGIGE